jgi:hypothetical protein
MKILIASAMCLGLAGCVIEGVKTGPLSDPQVLAQRCAEVNLAVTAYYVIAKNPDEAKITKVRGVIDYYCSGGAIVTDYPSALNAVANALILLKK